MKHFNSIKSLFITAMMGAAAVANGQTSHPLSFSTSVGDNHFKDYVGVRLQAVNPSSVAGDYHYTTSNDGSTSTANWGGFVTTPIVNVEVDMPSPDSFGCVGATPGSLAGKIAIVWRGPLSPAGAACEFGHKAKTAQDAGAVACIIVNEYPGEGPVGMAAGSEGALVTIPVFMIGNLDGIKLSAAFHASGPGTPGAVRMTITPWGLNKANDLGFVPGGVSTFHNFAIPAHQLFATGTHNAYKGINGAFVANYGTNDAYGSYLKTSTTFTATGSSTPVSVHSDSIALNDTFKSVDSIYTYFGSEYVISDLGGTGRFDVNYTIGSDSLDDFAFDNTYTQSFYATDSIYSKGRYDFAADRPIATLWTGATADPNPVLSWGVPYFIANGNSGIKHISFSASSGPGPLPADQIQFFIFKWTDGSGGIGALDSAIEVGELDLKGVALKTFNGTTDSSFEFFNSNMPNTDTTFGGAGAPVELEANSWYFILASSSSRYALGCDGILSAYPRSYGRKHFNNYTELYNPIISGTKDEFRGGDPSTPFLSWAFGGGSFDVDSVFFNSQIGLIPNLSMRVFPYTPNAVANVPNVTGKFNVYPNPASDVVNFEVAMDKPVSKITYTVLDGLGKQVASEARANIQADKYTLSTAKLPAGTYFVVVTADERQVFRKFTIVK